MIHRWKRFNYLIIDYKTDFSTFLIVSYFGLLVDWISVDVILNTVLVLVIVVIGNHHTFHVLEIGLLWSTDPNTDCIFIFCVVYAYLIVFVFEIGSPYSWNSENVFNDYVIIMAVLTLVALFSSPLSFSRFSPFGP